MQICFSNNPIDKLSCWLNNKYEEFTQFRWQLKHHRVECRICGDVLDSNEIKFSPEQCGWKRLKDQLYKPWICHTCLEHINFKPYIRMIKEAEEKD